MKLAFSTLGVPGLPISDVVRLAASHGYHGVELRTHPEEPVHTGLDLTARAEVAAEFKTAGVEILGLAGYARVAAPGDDEPVLAEIRDLLLLARDLGAPFIRVFPGGDSGPTTPGQDPGQDPGQSTEEADATAARRLGTAAEYAADLGVRILLETHDSHRTGADAIRVLGPVGHRQAGALWDVMHTWLGGEQPSASFAALSPFLGYVQVKDIASADDTTPLALGAGVLPLTECVDVLSREGWDGWLCWEYEKRWYESAAPLEGLLSAGHNYLSQLLNEAA
ncbi:sugar phosphate isomerase/epimerase family protein [Streptomyces kroppenstedtii]|uniref:sugar phosphate isomerase/epimerase family protein n=1 Tax=Streptomyces kroppenstedtii TaxID=3051181 RepID=UPI0028D619BD|nr:sugar phosphate isomerase/epimerase family protein [Streptomyces sp. DSM 40484]